MELSERVRTGADAELLYDLVFDLSTYPDWLGLVAQAERDDAMPKPRDSIESVDVAEAGPDAWIVELRGRVGPFARSKRLRMVRTVAIRPRHVCFERVELERREYASWRLEAIVEQERSGSTLIMNLAYGGSRFAPILTPILRDEIRRARRLLLQRYPLED